MKSQVPFKKTSNMENYRKSHGVILVDLEPDFIPLAAVADPEVVFISCRYEQLQSHLFM